MTIKTNHSIKLINFNAPRQLIDAFDQLLKYKGVSRTSQLLHLINNFLRSEHLLLRKDSSFTSFMQSISETERHRMVQMIHDTYEPPMIPFANDHEDWEQRLMSLWLSKTQRPSSRCYSSSNRWRAHSLHTLTYCRRTTNKRSLSNSTQCLEKVPSPYCL